MQTVTYIAAGHRRLTPAMIAAQQRLKAIDEVEHAEATRGQIIVAFKRVSKALGCSKSLRQFVLFLIEKTYPCDWLPGATPISGPSNRHLSHELDIERTQIKNLSRQAAEMGLLTFKDSPQGSRRVVRSGPGKPIIYGYGFDLSPLRARYAEFLAIADAVDERRREGEAYRRKIFTLRKDIKIMLASLAEAGAAGDDDYNQAEQADELAAIRGTELDPATLGPIAAQLHAIRDSLESRLSAVFSVESDPQGPAVAAPITTTNPKAIAFSKVDKKENPNRVQVNQYEAAPRRLIAPEKERVRSDGGHNSESVEKTALNGFVASPLFILKIAAMFRDVVPTAKPNERQIIDAAEYVCTPLGISRHAWGQACVILGRYAAAVCVAVIAAKAERGLIRSPGGVLRAMVSRHQSGELHLDRTLYGLADLITAQGVA